MFNNIETFLTKVDINSKEEWKDEDHSQILREAQSENNLFKALREKQYNKKGLDLRKNFCHHLTTKKITINMNMPIVDQKEEVRSASPGLRRIKHTLEKLKCNPLGNMNNSIESVISVESVKFTNCKMKRMMSDKRCTQTRSKEQDIDEDFTVDDEWKHQFQSPRRTRYHNPRVRIFRKPKQRKRSENLTSNRFDINLPSLSKNIDHFKTTHKATPPDDIWKELMATYRRMNN